MPVLTRADVNIYFEVHGSGPALLLTHGFSATSEMWSGQIESLAAEHTLITWDMRGHGRSDSPQTTDAYSAELTVADMAALLGANDEPFLNATDYMAAKIPGATEVVIPDAGHASNIDQPAAFNAAVQHFLEANDL